METHRNVRAIQYRRIIYNILGTIEGLLAFRLLFKMLGASSKNILVSVLYTVTYWLTAPFIGIFNIFSAKGGNMWFIFEPSTVIAMIVYALLARWVVNLLKIRYTKLIK